MSTPLERLTVIVNCHTPAKIKFKLSGNPARSGSIVFESVVVKDTETIPPPEDMELYELLKSNLSENWNADSMKYEKTTTIESLWYTVSLRVVSQYEKHSARCTATKRKTTDFIGKIKVDDKLLAGFLLQTFVKVQSSDYKLMSANAREVLFEQFDSLRRTFGKRV